MKQLLIAIALVIGFSGVANAYEYQTVRYVDGAKSKDIYTSWAKLGGTNFDLKTVVPGTYKMNINFSCGRIFGIKHTLTTQSMLEVKDNRYRFTVIKSKFVGSNSRMIHFKKGQKDWLGFTVAKTTKHYSNCVKGINEFLTYMDVNLTIVDNDF